jgi:thiol-disulfide isomerase/thioredoxin
MVSVNSTMLPLGTEPPDFSAPDPNGKIWSRDEVMSSAGLLVAFICNHCPYVRHIGHALGTAARRWEEQGIGVVGINSNDTEAYPDDAPDKMLVTAEEFDWRFPYLVDEDQRIAKDYRAACTPDFFLFDADRRLFYRGQFDSSRPRNDDPITGADLDAAVQALLAGDPPPRDQWPSMGCNIKWKPDNEPDYFA